MGCALAGPCFSHSTGACGEDGSLLGEECQPAIPCAPCFPNSRCGTGGDEEDEVEDESIKEVEEDATDLSVSAATSGGAGPRGGVTVLASPILAVAVVVLSWCWMAV